MKHFSLSHATFALGLASLAACSTPATTTMTTTATPQQSGRLSITPPSPDARVGLRGGLWDAGSAIWNLKLVSATKPSEKFVGSVMSDLAFTGNNVIQGSFNGYQIWDISNPAAPTLKVANYCPASQSDVSVYKNLLFVSSEGNAGRIDCGDEGVKDPVSKDRIRGIRIFDISDLAHPKNIANVQTCRGSHTHSVLVDPKDPENIYVYVSGSAGVRPAQELAGCNNAMPDKDPNSSLFRIEVIKVPLAHPEQAAIVSSPRIFNDLAAPPTHGETQADKAAAQKTLEAGRTRGAFIVNILGQDQVLSDRFAAAQLDSLVKVRGGSGAPTAADSAKLRTALPGIIAKILGDDANAPKHGPTQCHDITLYPAIGYAGGACEGYGLLLDIKNPTAPVRMGAVSDSNFSYWHSATFNNDGTKVLFSDEWGGGGAPKCRSTDPKEWGADAIFTISNGKMQFQSYYKLPAPQTSLENCVAHNGSLIPIPGRDVMVQAWYQGGISVFDWTDAAHPVEIAYHDRGPVDSTHFTMGGSWSVYWYNGVIVSSEIARGLDIYELTPSAALTQNEIDAAKSVHLDYLNTQGQPKYVWPASFALSRAYADQLERGNGLAADKLAAARAALTAAERLSGAERKAALSALATKLHTDARGARDEAKAHVFASSVGDLANATR